MSILSRLNYIKTVTHYKGYAIHSPFIFNLVSDVLLTHYPFTAFPELRLYHKYNNCPIPFSATQKVFRALNSLNPASVETMGVGEYELFLLTCVGLKTMEELGEKDTTVEFLLIGSHFNGELPECKTILVLLPETRNKEVWKQVETNPKVKVTIHFYHFALAFTETVSHPSHYRIF